MNRVRSPRRRFLKSASALTAAAALPGMQVMRQARAAAQPRTLIAIHLGGGNDTLNTLIPVEDPLYYSIRGGLAIPKADALPITGRQALHPALAGLKRLYDAGAVAIVNAVGYPRFNYSHFEAMQIYWMADPARASSTGWLGRTLDLVVAGTVAGGGLPDVLTGAAIGGEAPPSLIARSFTAPLLPPNPSAYVLPVSDPSQQDALERILQQPATTTNYLYDACLRNSAAALQAYKTVQTAGALPTPVTYPDRTFARGLRFAVQLMRTDPEVRVIAMQQGSYDTHENQLATHTRHLGVLSDGLAAFMEDVATHGLGDRVLVLLWSEFARRIQPNDTDGTDHGSAQAVVVIGQGVRGGVIGDPPSLDPADFIDGGNLKAAFDFRQVYATVLDGWLGIDSKVVLGAGWGTLPILL